MYILLLGRFAVWGLVGSLGVFGGWSCVYAGVSLLCIE